MLPLRGTCEAGGGLRDPVEPRPQTKVSVPPSGSVPQEDPLIGQGLHGEERGKLSSWPQWLLAPNSNRPASSMEGAGMG